MNFYNVYFYDLLFKLTYFLISFAILFCVFFNNINVYFLFEALPFIGIFYHKRFITTHVTDLFNTMWVLSFYYSSLFTFPLLSYWTLSFSKSGWYFYQKTLYKIILICFFSCFVLWFYFFHLNIVPIVLDFLLHWELADQYYLLRVESEISFFFYVSWILIFKCNFSLISSYLVTFTAITFLFKEIFWIYLHWKKYMKLLGFIIIVFLYLLMPPDFMIQIFLALLIYCYTEFFYYVICLFLYKIL